MPEAPPPLEDKDRRAIATHLLRLESATEPGDIITAVHWLKKTLHRYGSSLAVVAENPELLTGHTTTKLHAYVHANRQYAERERSLLAENKKLRLKHDLRNPNSPFYKFVKWASYFLLGPVGFLAHHCLNKEHVREEYLDEEGGSNIVLGYAGAVALAAIFHGAINTQQSIQAKMRSSDLREAAAAQLTPHSCNPRTGTVKWCESPYAAAESSLSSIPVLSIYGSRRESGRIVMAETAEKVPIVDITQNLIGWNLCLQSHVYRIKSDNTPAALANGLAEAEKIGSSQSVCEYLPPSGDEGVSDTPYIGKRVLVEVIGLETRAYPVADKDGVYAGRYDCTRPLHYMFSGRVLPEKEREGATAKRPNQGNAGQWTCTFDRNYKGPSI